MFWQRLYEPLDKKSSPVAPWKEPGHGTYEALQSFPSSGNWICMLNATRAYFLGDLTGKLVSQIDVKIMQATILRIVK